MLFRSVVIVHVVVQRAHMDEVMAIVDRYDPQAFVTAEEPKILRGGSFASRAWPGSGWGRLAATRRQRV